MTELQLIGLTKVKFYIGSGFPIGGIYSPTTPSNFVRIEDVTSLSLSGTESVKFLFKVTSPAGNVIYKNTGYDGDVYTVSDRTTDVIYTMPLTAGGEPQEGQYKIEIKIKYADSATPANDFTTSKTILSPNYCLCDKPTIEIGQSYDCDLAIFSSVDNTSYSSSTLTFSALSRTHIIRPPLASGLGDQTNTTATLQLSNLWTGTYQSQVKSWVSFIGANTYNGASDTTLSECLFYQTGEASVEVICNDVLCEMYCGLKKIEAKYKSELNVVEKAKLLNKMTLGADYLTMAKESRGCGDTEKLSYWQDRFYEETGLDKNCDCGCNEGESAPVIPRASSTSSSTVYVVSSDGSILVTQTSVSGGIQYDLSVGFEASVIDTEVDYQSQTGMYFTINTSTNKFVPKYRNQKWKTILANGTTINPSNPDHLLNQSPQIEVPAYEASLPISSNSIKIRYTHDGKLAIKGSFVYTYGATSVPSFEGKVLFFMPFLPTNGSLASFNAIVKHTVAELANIKDYRSDMFIASEPAYASGVPFFTFNFIRNNSGGDTFTVRIDDIVDLKNIFI